MTPASTASTATSNTSRLTPTITKQSESTRAMFVGKSSTILAIKMSQHSHTDEHQEKAKYLGLPAGIVLRNLSESEDVPLTNMSVLVNEVANASSTTAIPSVDSNLIQSIVESEAFKAAAASVHGRVHICCNCYHCRGNKYDYK